MTCKARENAVLLDCTTNCVTPSGRFDRSNLQKQSIHRETAHGNAGSTAGTHRPPNDRAPRRTFHGTLDHGRCLSRRFLAALAAVSALYAEHFATDATLEQIKASDTWNRYQANSIKEKVILENKKDLARNLEFPSTTRTKKSSTITRRTRRRSRRRRKDSLRSRKGTWPGRVPLSRSCRRSFECAIAIGAVSVLTKQRAFWYVSLGFGGVGIVFLIRGFSRFRRGGIG